MKISIIKTSQREYFLKAGRDLLAFSNNLKQARMLKQGFLKNSVFISRFTNQHSELQIDFNEYQDDDEPLDEFEEAMSYCGGFWDGEVFMCGSVGSEQCEFECPFNKDIGKTVDEIEIEIDITQTDYE
jgi:hypothetical protein